MRGLVVGCLLLWVGLPSWAATRVSAAELDKLLSEAGRSSNSGADSKLAMRLKDVELTERPDATELGRWRAETPGAKSRMALDLLADQAEFLEAPGDAGHPVPEIGEQRQMIVRAKEYVKSVLPQLPDFMATRETEQFEEKLPVGPSGEELRGRRKGLHLLGSATDTVYYRDGREVADAASATPRKHPEAHGNLHTGGVFGPILGIVLTDALRGRLDWSRWERGPNGLEPVFRYSVPQNESHYEVLFCCLVFSYGGEREFRKLASYHGEMAIDPATGTILRLTAIADMAMGDPIERSDLVVEYAQVAIGGNTYTCPARSVAMQVNAEPGTGVELTSLNVAVFSGYRKFGSETRILAGDGGDPP